MKKILILLISFFTLQTLAAQTYNIKDFNAKGHGENDTKAIQKAIDECSKNGGTVIFPAGTFATGTIYLKSNVTIHLSKGAVWTAVPDPDLFPYQEIVVPGRMDVVKRKAFIYAANQENISITGEGTISPRGDHEIWQTHKGDDPERPYGLRIVQCKNVTFKDIKLINSAFWMMHIYFSDFIKIDGVEIFNHCNMNNDGIDIDGCHNVVISNCIIDSEDDALVFKSEGYRGCEDIVVNNCILSSFASPFKMGTGSVYGFRRISATNCVIRPSKSKENHHNLQAWGGLAGIDLGNVDGGTMEDITISNFVIDSVETPIFIRLGARHDRFWEGVPQATGGITKNIKISDIVATSSDAISCAITGYPGHRVENITFQNIQVHFFGKGTAKDTSLKVPEVIGGYPVNRMFGGVLPAYGFYVRHAENVHFDQVRLFLLNPDERPAFVFDDVHDASLTNFYADHNSKIQPLIRIVNSSGITIEGDSKLNDIENFIQVQGETSSGIRLKDNFMLKETATFAPVNFKAEPINETISEIKLSWNSSNNKNVGLNQFLIYRNGEEIKRTRKTTYTDQNIEEGEKYTYQIAALNGYGMLSEKKSATVTSLTDKKAPVLTSHYLVDNRTLNLYFSEPLNKKTALDISNYEFDKDISIQSIKINEKQNKLILTTTPLTSKQKLSITNINDDAKKENKIKTTSILIEDNPLVGYWIAENEGEITPDKSNNNNTAKFHNAQWINGKVNQALLFAGTDNYINCGNDSSLNISGDMAVSVWFKVDNPSAAKYYRILSKRKIWNSPTGYELEINPSQNRINISGGAKDGAQQGIIQYQFDDQWHQMVAMIKNGAAYVYIDGNLIGKDENVAEPAANDVPLFIGATPGNTDNFEGALDELKIYNRALSEQEIEKLAQP